jgi:hypothetical protein
VISSVTTERQATMIVRTGHAATGLPVTDPAWEAVQPSLDEIVLAYLRQRAPGLPQRQGRRPRADHEPDTARMEAR